MITSMRQVREMMTIIMISEGEDIAMKMDSVYKETVLPGSQEGLGSSVMLHHECRHMAAHLRNTNNHEGGPRNSRIKADDQLRQ